MILLIDDEPRFLNGLLDYLRSGLDPNETSYDVHVELWVDPALVYLHEHRAVVELVIMDVMMPAGRAFAEKDTRLGLRTGIYLYETLRTTEPDLPVLVLTNSHDADVVAYFTQKARADKPRCRFVHKEHYFPAQVKQIIGEMLAESTRQRPVT